MAYDADKIIEVATELKRAREEVNQLEAKLRSLVVTQTLTVNLTESISKRARLVGLFNAEPNKDFSADEVWRKLKLKESYVRPMLSRLVKERKIEKRGYGLYGALGGSKEKSQDSSESRLPLQ